MEIEDKENIQRSKDGRCPYCGSAKVGPAGGFAARGGASSTKLPELVKNLKCDDCGRPFFPPSK